MFSSNSKTSSLFLIGGSSLMRSEKGNGRTVRCVADHNADVRLKGRQHQLGGDNDLARDCTHAVKTVNLDIAKAEQATNQHQRIESRSIIGINAKLLQ